MKSDLHRMYAIGVMAFIVFLSTLVSLPVLPRLSAELGAATHQIPIVISAALATVVIVQFFAGSLADRFSRQRLILIGTALGSVFFLLVLDCERLDSFVDSSGFRWCGGCCFNASTLGNHINPWKRCA